MVGHCTSSAVPVSSYTYSHFSASEQGLNSLIARLYFQVLQIANGIIEDIVYQFIENSCSLPTFAQRADENPKTGLNASITSVNIQPFVQTTINPVKKIITA